VLHAIGSAVEAPVRWVGHAVAAVARVFPGGVAGVWAALAIAVLAGTAAAARRYARLRAIESAAGSSREDRGAPTAAQLERDAELAEREGRLEQAVRRRFAAGLARLAEQGLLGSPQSTPTRELAATLRSDEFDALAGRFDEIAYGEVPATVADVEQATRSWPRVLREAAR
jgi:hypothetical protein